jgi:hypothetical protein
MDWFQVDKAGLAKILERRGTAFVLFELIANGWDERSTRVEVTLERVPGSPYARMTVEDDNPQGFATLEHAFTLFAPSRKTGEAEMRGRFNLGEKLVLAMCVEAEIASTTGTIVFDAAGRRRRRATRAVGSKFSGVMRMTNADIAECAAAVTRLLPPQHIATVFNGTRLPSRTPVGWFEVALPTEIADPDGVLRRSIRKTIVTAYEPAAGEVAALYEMGIPVVDTGDRWHLNIGQKVPLNLERDNVPPAYLAKVRAAALESMHDRITAEDANSTWVRDALQRHGETLPVETIERVMTERFGARRVAYDPSDPEANAIATSCGYVVVHGGQLSASEWAAAKRAGSIPPAGQVTPSPKPYSENGDPLRLVAPEQWTPAMTAVAEYARRVGRRVLDIPVRVSIVNDPHWHFLATYGAGRLTLNAGRLGFGWFSGPLPKINELLIHEYAHHFASNHLSRAFHDACCRVGAAVAQMALHHPEEMAIESVAETT